MNLLNSAKMEKAVQQFLDQIVEDEQLAERRRDPRTNVSVVVALVPLVDGRPVIDRAFATFTKNVSQRGVALVLNKPFPEEELMVGFPGPLALRFARADVLYRDIMPLGCYTLGLRVQELVDAADYPEVQGLRLGAGLPAAPCDSLPLFGVEAGRSQYDREPAETT